MAQSRVLEVGFSDGKTFRIPFELMRVYSPSAEVQGHGPGAGGAADRQARGRADGARAGRQLRGAADASPTATTPASSPGTTSTSSARSRPSSGRSTRSAWPRPAPAATSRCRRRPLPPPPAAIRIEPARERNPLRLRHGRRDDKAARVRGVFDSVAPKYDLMNDLMSLGLHRAWKAYTVAVANVRPGDRVLDLAGGTGDLARAFAAPGGRSRRRRPHRHQRGDAAPGPRPPARRRQGAADRALRCRDAAVRRAARSTSSASPSACAT